MVVWARGLLKLEVTPSPRGQGVEMGLGTTHKRCMIIQFPNCIFQSLCQRRKALCATRNGCIFLCCHCRDKLIYVCFVCRSKNLRGQQNKFGISFSSLSATVLATGPCGPSTW